MNIGRATLLNVDCMEYMKTLADNEFDLAIVDPPYGINVAKNGTVGGGGVCAPRDYGAKDWDSGSPDREYFEILERVSRNQIIWGANHFMHKLCRGSSCWLVWDKDNGGDFFADSELAYTSFKTAVRNFRFQWKGMLQGDMKNKEIRVHPTQKPVKLYEWILANYAQQGDRIIDTHLGSGSNAIACNNLGFEMVGCELDKEYFEAACERIDNGTRQRRMFA